MGSKINYSVCMCMSRSYKTTDVEPSQDVKDVFRKYSEGKDKMTENQFHIFLGDHNGANLATEVDTKRIFEQVLKQCNHMAKQRNHGLSELDFHHFLLSAELNPAIQSSPKVHDDMSAPLSHYFIYTGHNSYLTGNQISSLCSHIPIINALKRGVRVIELDLWPTSDGDNARVRHGRTLTTSVELKVCLEAIKNNAFSASDYPVIITLEDHLTPVIRTKVAQMIRNTFPTMLYIPEPNEKKILTPKELMRRVLISTKPTEEYKVAGRFKKNDLQMEEDSDDDDVRGQKPGPSNLPADNKNKEKIDICDCDDLEDEEPDEYRSIIAIHSGKPRGGLENLLRVEKDVFRRLSLSESTLERRANTNGTDIVSFTQQNILRVYPKATRIFSTNYKPHTAWMHGAQMVAFNMQGNDKALRLMHGMFRANGGCGYVKKPDFLINKGSNNSVFNPKAKLPVKKTLKVKVYMGDGWQLDFKQTHFDAHSPPDFFTRVGIAGAPADKIMKKTKTEKNKWTPVWNEEFDFALTVPELALLRIEVHEDDISGRTDFAGQTCLPVSELKEGIRAIPLCDRNGDQYGNARLLMRFEIV